MSCEAVTAVGAEPADEVAVEMEEHALMQHEQHVTTTISDRRAAYLEDHTISRMVCRRITAAFVVIALLLGLVFLYVYALGRDPRTLRTSPGPFGRPPDDRPRETPLTLSPAKPNGRCPVYTYIAPLADVRLTDLDVGHLLEIWEHAWLAAGYEPIILTQEHAQMHPRFDAFRTRIHTYPTSNGRGYEDGQQGNSVTLFAPSSCATEAAC
jgi:hypothetical protein